MSDALPGTVSAPTPPGHSSVCQDDDGMHRALDALIAGAVPARGPGIVAAIRHNGRMLCRAAYGLASVELGVPLQPSTRIAIGSVTKQFTAAALLVLEREGRLSLDDRVGTHLPELAGVSALPTLRQLLSMTGGLRDYLDVAMAGGVRTLCPGEPLAIQCRQSAANFAPGTDFGYCNGAYLLASHVVERVAKQPFRRVLRERLFEPLGMRATEVPVDVDRLLGDRATEHSPHGSGWRRSLPLTTEPLGDGGMVSTVDDLLRWTEALRHVHGLVSLAALTEPSGWNDGRRCDYRLGVVDERWRGARLVQHSGSILGATAQLALFPEHGLEIALLANGPAPLRALMLRSADLVLADALSPATAAPRAVDHPALVGALLLDAEARWLIGFGADGEGLLQLQLQGVSSAPLVGIEPDVGELPFAVVMGGVTTRFRVEQTAGGRVVRLGVRHGPRWRTAEAIRQETATTAPFPNLRGGETFACIDADVDLHVVRNGPRVRFRLGYKRSSHGVGLHGVTRSLATAPLPDVDAGTLWSDEDSGDASVERLLWSTVRTRCLEFVRRR